jgi:DNA-binding transcriptional MerR regulator
MTRSMLQIGELARLLGVTPKTVRHYQKLGLIDEPERSESGYRLYTASDLLHLQRIRRLQALGLSLERIKVILEDDDPDSLLHATLHRLQNELVAQQQRIEERQRRIQRYLDEGASLREVEQPEMPSPTYQLFKDKIGDFPGLPESMIQFDQQIFSQWDSFDWGEQHKAVLYQTAQLIGQQNDPALAQLLERMVLLQTMPEDDPRVAEWANEFRQSSLMQSLLAALPGSTLEPPFTETIRQLFMQSADEHLSPAQRHFIELLVTV